MRAYITNTAVFLPNDPVSNDRMESLLGMVGGRPSRARRVVLNSNGIRRRYYALDPATGRITHTNAEMTANAVRGLFDSEQELAAIDCLVCGTSMPDQMMPSHAVMVHGELGNRPCEVSSTTGICLSGMSALKYGFMGVRSGEFRTAVATGSELASPSLRACNFEAETRKKLEELAQRPELAFEKEFLRWMLSDGAGAFRLESEPVRRGDQPIFAIEWIEFTSFANELETCMYFGADKRADGSLKGWRLFDQGSLLDHSVLSVKQDVKLLKDHIVETAVTRTLERVVRKHPLRPEQVDWFLPHISSMYFHDKVHDALQAMGFGIPVSRWFTNLESCGNTGSASIYIMLDELARSGRLRAGQRLLCFIPESGRFSSAYMLLTVQ